MAWPAAITLDYSIKSMRNEYDTYIQEKHKFQASVNGASMSEPYTSDLNGGFSKYGLLVLMWP